MFDYPVVLEPQPEGGFVVTFPDVPEAITQGEDEDEALLYAIDALETALSMFVETRRPLLANVTGGLSGPAIHAAAVRGVWEVFNKFGRDVNGPGKHLPIIGLGGVSNWRDVAEFILAGATAVGMGTALFADPRSPLRIVRGLEKWLARQGVASIRDLVGAINDEPRAK